MTRQFFIKFPSMELIKINVSAVDLLQTHKREWTDATILTGDRDEWKCA
jgi:hypothetical protein